MKDSVVTYSNEAKIHIGVDKTVIDCYGVYSLACASCMALAGIRWSVNADIAVGVSGSLNRVDPANPKDSKPGQVFVGVVTQDPTKWASFIVDVDPGLNRRAAKDEIVNKVFRFLTEFIPVQKI